jgi:hypothetical protein
MFLLFTKIKCLLRTIGILSMTFSSTIPQLLFSHIKNVINKTDTFFSPNKTPNWPSVNIKTVGKLECLSSGNTNCVSHDSMSYLRLAFVCKDLKAFWRSLVNCQTHMLFKTQTNESVKLSYLEQGIFWGLTPLSSLHGRRPS